MGGGAGAGAGAAVAVEVISKLPSYLSLLQGRKAFKFQQQAQRIEWEEKIRTYQYNIERSREEAGILTGDIRREGALFQRGQMASMGASGAEVGGGTPLMNMLQTQAGIARDILNVQRASEMEIDFYEQEIETYEGLLHREDPLTSRQSRQGVRPQLGSGGLYSAQPRKRKTLVG